MKLCHHIWQYVNAHLQVYYISLPPGGRGTACGGRSPRDKRRCSRFLIAIFSLSRALPQSLRDSSLPEGAYGCRRAALCYIIAKNTDASASVFFILFNVKIDRHIALAAVGKAMIGYHTNRDGLELARIGCVKLARLLVNA